MEYFAKFGYVVFETCKRTVTNTRTHTRRHSDTLIALTFTPHGIAMRYYFYPRGASDARVIAVIGCLYVCLCVTRRYCIKTAKRKITQTTPRDSRGTLIF